MAGKAVHYWFEAASAPQLERALDPWFALQLDSGHTRQRSFYDTFDRRLHRAGLSLVRETRRLALVDRRGQERAGLDWSGTRKRLFAGDLQPGPLRDLLVPLVEVRALTPVARVRSRRRLGRVLDAGGELVGRLELEEPALPEADGARLRPRLYARGVRGSGKAFSRVRRLLEAELGLAAADLSLQEEALARSNGTRAGVPTKPQLRIDRGERAANVAARISRALLEVIEVNLPGAIADTDPEFLHDFRVAVRRTRSLQRELRRVFAAQPLALSRGEFRWLQRVTGTTRDLDVYALEFEALRGALPERQRADLEPLREALVRRRRRERRRMVRALRSSRTTALLHGWADLLSSLEQGKEPRGSRADAPIGSVAGGRIAKVYGRMLKLGGRIDDRSPSEALHELRKQGKELRYLLEFFESIYPKDVVKPMVRTLKALQDTLGRFHDRQVQAEMIRSLGEEVGELEGGTAALMAMGVLVERLERQQVGERAEFAGRFRAFASPKQRTLVRKGFG